MNLSLYYRLHHTLKKYHKFEYDEINTMYPWERDIKIMLINQDIEREETQK
jgi:hypothetical protein